MNEALRQNKAVIREYLRVRYTDAHLAEILDLARCGKLWYDSCCCFVGIPHRNHDGFAAHESARITIHYGSDRHSRFERAFRDLDPSFSGLDDSLRRVRIIPVVLAEVRRRRMLQQEAAQVPQAVEVAS